VGDTVFANGMAILHKGSGGKSMGAMPDVCLCPPPAPTGPVPTPLPNNSMASDIDGCATSVFIEGNPAGTVESFIKTSTGNEVSKPTGGGVASHATKGKTYFIMGSMDVLIEGKGAVRHLDTGTHNHGSDPGNTPPWPTVAAAMFKKGGVCEGQAEECKLVPYKPGCPDGKTPHHVVPAHCFLKTNEQASEVLGKFEDVADGLSTRELNEKGRDLGRNRKGEATFMAEKQRRIGDVDVDKADVEGTCRKGCEDYRSTDAPCVCVSGHSQHEGDHGLVHAQMDQAEANACAKKGDWTLAEATKAGAESVEHVTDCDADCIAAQINAYHEDACDMDEEQKLRADPGNNAQQAIAKKKAAAGRAKKQAKTKKRR
jgi:hypothetical protein